MSNIIFNIVGGAPPFTVTLINSDIEPFIINTLGLHSISNVNDGFYTLSIEDDNGCMFEKDITVNQFTTTTTTTQLAGNSIVVGHTNDPIVVFNTTGTNRNNKYVGYPDPNIVTLYLWFKTRDGNPLTSIKIFDYVISKSIDDPNADSQFLSVGINDQVHVDNQDAITGTISDSLIGKMILQPGFIEAYYEYTYYKGVVNSDFYISLSSDDNVFDNTLSRRQFEAANYGLDVLTPNYVEFIY